MRDKNIRAVRGRRKGRMAMRAAVLMLSVGCSLLLTGCWGTGPAYGWDRGPDLASIRTHSGKGGTWKKWFPMSPSRRFYLESDVVFLPELLGVWNDEENGIGVIFEARGKRGYRITFTGKDGKTGIKGRLVRLGGELYLQLRWRNSGALGHIRRIGRIRVEGETLRMANLPPRSKKYRYLFGFWGETGASDYFHGGGLRKKLRQHLIDTADKYLSFEKSAILRRVSPPQVGEGRKPK